MALGVTTGALVNEVSDKSENIAFWRCKYFDNNLEMSFL